MQKDAPVSPELFWDALSGYQRSAAIKAAVELDIFTAIGKEPRTAEELASATGSSERGTRILADTMTVMGFLNKSAGRFSLTDSSATFLDKTSPAYIGSVANFLLDPELSRGFASLTEAVKRGGTAIPNEGTVAADNDVWVTFARSMAPMMFPAAQQMAEIAGLDAEQPVKVLDVAAGHGIFGVMMAQRYPKAEVYAVDWANVLTVARENAEKFGVADRFHEIPGSAFDTDLGEGYGLILLTNFLHHFDPPTCESFLARCKNALTPGGKILTLEFIPNEDRVSPPQEAFFSLVMLATTPAGDAYTFNELRQMFENAGLTRNEHIPLSPTPQHLIVSQE